MLAALLAATAVASAPAPSDIATIDATCVYSFQAIQESLPCTVIAGYQGNVFGIGFAQRRMGLMAFYGQPSDGGIAVTHFAMTEIDLVRLDKPGRCNINTDAKSVVCSAELFGKGTLEIFALVNK